MKFREVEPDENYDLKRFVSEPGGLWECGVLRMLLGKARVRMALAARVSDTPWFVPIDYWGGDQETALLMLGFIMGISARLPEGISQEVLVKFFPEQGDKELGPLFWKELFLAGGRAREVYGDFQE